MQLEKKVDELVELSEELGAYRRASDRFGVAHQQTRDQAISRQRQLRNEILQLAVRRPPLLEAFSRFLAGWAFRVLAW